jgi:hypothetical protein
MAKKINSRTRDSSLTNSTCLIKGSSQDKHPIFPYLARILTYLISDLIILSNNKSISTKSKTDYSNLNINSRAKSNSGSLYPDNKPAGSNSFSPGTIRVSSNLITNYPDNSNISNYNIFNNS